MMVAFVRLFLPIFQYSIGSDIVSAHRRDNIAQGAMGLSVLLWLGSSFQDSRRSMVACMFAVVLVYSPSVPIILEQPKTGFLIVHL